VSFISLTDEPDAILKKIMRAVTDSGKDVVYDTVKQPAISNLMTIYHHATGKNMKEIENEFTGKGYGDFKAALADAIIAMLAPIQTKLNEYKKDPTELGRILDAGRDAASKLAGEKMKIVRERVGLGRS
ncbi:tryptophan--tRNA ligase, partial [Patescibacteria group bacterium]|nr:tryptophan--tRNA ligase [Patescibacteria group bacterium]MBU1630091.1 tryptophan--tRNA ligase [Patescibacteria group bacterium]